MVEAGKYIGNPYTTVNVAKTGQFSESVTDKAGSTFFAVLCSSI